MAADKNDFERKTYTAGKFTVEEFPQAYLNLDRELREHHLNHPKLMKLLEGQVYDDLDVKLAIISHYCGVALDGTYTLAERAELCAILCGRLEMLREIVVPMPQIIQ